MKFIKPQNKTFKRKVWYCKLASFERYREILVDYNLEEKLNLSTDIDENIKHITEAIMFAAAQAIQNKVATIRPAKHPWITCHIRNLIRKRKRTYRKFKRTSIANLWEKYKIICNKIVSLMRKSRNDYFEKLDSLLSTETTDMKLFWKTAKQLLNLGKSSIIPTLNSNDERVENVIEKATLLNTYFASQSTLVDDNRSMPQLSHVEHSLQTITTSRKHAFIILTPLNPTFI